MRDVAIRHGSAAEAEGEAGAAGGEVVQQEVVGFAGVHVEDGAEGVTRSGRHRERGAAGIEAGFAAGAGGATVAGHGRQVVVERAAKPGTLTCQSSQS